MQFKSTAFALLFGALAFTACDKDEDKPAATNDTVELTATINGQQEVPANNSAATGTMTGSYNKTTRVLTYTVTYQGLTPAAGHIHQAAPGVNGGVMVPFSSVTTSPITGTATLSQADGDALLAGNSYVNLHTQAFTAGEIRGNIRQK
ncbi:CHRD domain-containing protein [Hymenobacter sp. B81]|uniref:CHRD domain-containing protein n=1 Tax=Hymenobacter sp. B81 TaxID=3344878 RepID=UPI0037DDCE85